MSALIGLINKANLRMACIAFVEQGAGVIGGTVVYNNQLPILESLRKDTLYRLLNVQGVVVGGNDDGNVHLSRHQPV